MVDVEGNQENVINMLSGIKRDGMSDLIEYLKESDFFTAPASTRYHRCYEGGLCEHSLNVTSIFSERNRVTGKIIDSDSVILCGVLHDLCKVGLYYIDDGKYKYFTDHPAEKSHARLSIEIIENFIELKSIEKEIILYHMFLFGCYGRVVEYTPEQLHAAISRNPLVQIFAACDMEESRWID